jgi:hypothetical protein
MKAAAGGRLVVTTASACHAVSTVLVKGAGGLSAC